jgi:hypothetical protein
MDAEQAAKDKTVAVMAEKRTAFLLNIIHLPSIKVTRGFARRGIF